MPEPTTIDLRELTGSTTRVAFVGQSTFFEACSLEPAPGAGVGLETVFVEYRDGAPVDGVVEALAGFRPDVTVVFRPEILPRGAFHEVPGAVLGYLTEPLPRRGRDAAPHPDLDKRLGDLRRIDPGNVDRVVSFDPKIAATACEVVPVWRSVPLPVADRFYRPVAGSNPHPKALFVGRSTGHREKFLAEAKEEGAVLHLAFGVGAEHLQELMAGHDIAVNVHNEPYPTFENRVCLHLAAGQLLISEPLSPGHGLEAGIDYLEAAEGAVLAEMLGRLRHMPGVWRDVRLRGRQKAELYRASRVYPRLIFDLLADLASAPSSRPGAGGRGVA